MAPIDVLVYKGPGVSETSLYHTLKTLRDILTPNYTVKEVEAKLLETEPWPESCALLVIPGGRDLPYVQHLAKSIDKIKYFVSDGGAYLGICAGAYFGSSRVEWEVGTPLEVVGDRALKFFPGTCRGCAYPGFEYESEKGAQLLDITATIHGDDTEQPFEGIYYNGGGVFEGADTLQMRTLGVKVTARYPNGKPAGVTCVVGRGTAALWGLHPEYSTHRDPYRTILEQKAHGDISDIPVREQKRLELMRGVLGGLGLSIPGGAASTKLPTAPLPQLLCVSPNQPGLVTAVWDGLKPHLKPSRDLEGVYSLDDSQDTFRFFAGSSERLAAARKEAEAETSADPSPVAPRDVIVFDKSLPSDTDAPLFSISSYFESLRTARGNSPFIPNAKWGVGEALMYGEAVTSTQTLFDRLVRSYQNACVLTSNLSSRNATLLSSLPHPVLSLATIQLAGRGRGSNAWLSPLGCLQFSILLGVPKEVPLYRTVFIQYIFGLAVTEACRKVLPSTEAGRVRLKWPNDIYILREDGTKSKIGGILVTTNYMDNMMHVVIGCGLNVLNNQPTVMSLAQLFPDGLPESLTMENVAANLMATFETMWCQFVEAEGSFEPFLNLYLERWLHSDEPVTLETTTPSTRVRICGISTDNGFLQTLPEPGQSLSSGEFIYLQPDGNSFDMMKGLIKTKK
ncbi:biotin-[acetyl-CoA-carboxylase] ligase [Ceratobasidium sp. AG-Ba]|nr:biotin-[acetyl-CoA-carboxylase] ligase [Ceratobasidium sp. AG-Ba]